MFDLLAGAKRTKYCGNYSIDDINKKVTIMGFIAKARDLGKMVFVDVRDRTGIIQISFDQSSFANFEKARKLRMEDVVCITGTVVSRGGNINKEISTGAIEVIAEELKILSKAEVLPFEIKDEVTAHEVLRLEYRYLDLRRKYLQEKIILRDKISMITRNYLSKNGFIDIETPFLGKSTPEGARDYLVPSRVHGGSFYALPQSPQLYKQLLMISGFDRYYQIARCFRDEDLRANRQPEFSQIDIEMSYVENVKDVMKIAEGLVKDIFKKTIGYKIGKIKKITYDNAIKNYGSDKPDTRFDLQLKDITKTFKNSSFNVFKQIAKKGAIIAINAKGLSQSITRREIDEYTTYVKGCGLKGLSWISIKEDSETSSFLKFISEQEKQAIYSLVDAKVGDTIIILADESKKLVQDTLGLLRLKIAKKHKLYDENIYDILWVYDFPLLDFDEEENRYVAMHHPFTSVKTTDIKYLDTKPLKARANAYDLVINGEEAGGGSIRIHDHKMQKKMFSLLGISDEDIKERFGFFVDAFKYGVPPHGGLAFGLDRLVMLLSKTDNIKDVIAFPKVQNASCLMSKAPSTVEKKQMDELSLSINKGKGNEQ